MKPFLKSAVLCACLGVLLGAGAPVEAQTVKTLYIYDGKVTINGQDVPESDLPDSLDLRGINATYTFIGDARPLIDLRGVLYVLDGQRLRAVDQMNGEDDEIKVYFRPGEDAEEPLIDRFGKQPGDGLLSYYLAKEQGQVLQEQSQELERLSNQVDQRQANQALSQARDHVAQAAEAVQLLPKLEVQSYLSDVRQDNQSLYALLVREWQMERATEVLAQEIRNLPEGALRTARITELNDMLQKIFELKQQNRRREIQQLEQQLDALNKQLQKREAWRDRLIQQRLEQLIGSPSSPNNR